MPRPRSRRFCPSPGRMALRHITVAPAKLRRPPERRTSMSHRRIGARCSASPVRHGRGAGFTLIELLVVIAIIAILAAILFPVFAKAREKARQTTCLSNTKQIGMALMQYEQDWDEANPGVWFGPVS